MTPDKSPERKTDLAEGDELMIRKLQLLIQIEEKKPENERDNALIDECIEEIAKLKGVRSSYSKEEVDAIVAELKHKGAKNSKSRSYRRYLKWLLPIAAILALTTVAVAASLNSLRMSDITKQFFSMLQPKTKYSEENVDLVITDDQKAFNSLEELADYFEQPLLLPYDIESEMQNLMILVDNYGNSEHITISFDYKNMPCFYDIDCPRSVSNTPSSYINEIGVQNAIESEYDGKAQIIWCEAGINYCVQSANNEIVKFIFCNVRFK